MPKSITLNHITKIEGHARLNLGIEKNKVTRCELWATEGSRYFEGIVRGRRYYEAHEMTSRICGICSCAHVVAAVSAIEDALSYTPTAQTKQLRELITLGERIRSHATHLYFLALPDYLGYPSAIEMAKKYKTTLQQALLMVKTGNRIIKLLAARDLHPVSVTVGGWLKLPSQNDILLIEKELEEIRDDAVQTVKLFCSLSYPDFETRGRSYSLVDKNRYAILDGDFSSGTGSFQKKDYRKHMTEYAVPYSNANFVRIRDSYFNVGALARIANSRKKLSAGAKKLLSSFRKFSVKNPFHNVIGQAIELLHCIDEGRALCRKISIRDERVEKMSVREGTGIGALEVPRGTLWHEYTLDPSGKILNANIITPTAQNLLNIQEDIRGFVPSIVGKKKSDLVMDVEKLIRSYDPCFSCSAHFLEVNWV